MNPPVGLISQPPTLDRLFEKNCRSLTDRTHDLDLVLDVCHRVFNP